MACNLHVLEGLEMKTHKIFTWLKQDQTLEHELWIAEYLMKEI